MLLAPVALLWLATGPLANATGAAADSPSATPTQGEQQSCTNRPVFDNPWPTDTDANRARHDLHAACKLNVGDAAHMAAGMVKYGMDRQTLESSLGLGHDVNSFKPGSMGFEFGHQVMDMALAGKSQDEIERALFCSCLALPLDAALDTGAYVYH